MTEITDLSPTDSSNTSVTGESLDGSIANMGRMDNTLQAVMGLLARSIRTNVMRWIDGADSTKRVALDLSGLPPATTRTWTAPYYSGTLGLLSDIRGYRFGLDLSRNVTDAANDIDIAAGSAVDSTGVISITLASLITKRIDATWAVGSGNGGLDTGVVGNGTYYIWLIRRPDTGVVDALFSLSSTAPTLPANYTQQALIGIVGRNSAANEVPVRLNLAQQNGSVIQSAAYDFTTYSTISSIIPGDNTIPQITEGQPVFSVNFTPTSATSKLRIRCSINCTTNGLAIAIAALFIGGAANAVRTGYVVTGGSDYHVIVYFEYEYTPASVANQAIQVRCGPGAGNLYVNGTTAARLFGGAAASTLVIEEIKA